MPSLSAVVITFNEERNIVRCLESLKEAADDIVVVDSFSTDRTAELCRGSGVTFIRRPWEGYSAAKNAGNAAARHDLVLSLDADEELSEELARSVASAAERPDADAYAFNRLTWYCGRWIRHGGWYPDVKTRLFDRTRARWEGAIHERLAGVDERRVRLLRGCCFHYTYRSVAGHLAQARAFADLAGRDLHDRGVDVPPLAAALHPPARFIRDYLFRAGFLDGKSGLLIAAITAYATYRKYAHLARLKRGKRAKP
jgi:glycosyltransferase involved in cell wall biosynthesis